MKILSLFQVESEHGKLKRELAAREKDKIEFTEKLQAMNDALKKAEENRAGDEQRYQKEKKALEKQMEDLKKESTRRRGANFLEEIGATLGGAILGGLPGGIPGIAASLIDKLAKKF